LVRARYRPPFHMDILFKYFWKDSKPVQEIDPGSDFCRLRMIKKYFITTKIVTLYCSLTIWKAD
ncbi:hypothetical protein, partial [Aliivibrio fischeri]|uniref:hypothetical protein n=1 Tax=Aliivibrio fischeri TaxID=668 RepID=UPI001A7E19C5